MIKKFILLLIISSVAYSQGYWEYKNEKWEYIEKMPEISARKTNDPTAGGAIKTNNIKLYYSNSMVQTKYVDGKVYKELIRNYVTEPQFQIESPDIVYKDMKCSGWVPAHRYNLKPLNKYLPEGFELTSVDIPATFKTPEPNSNNLLILSFVFLLFIRNLKLKII